jgi:hypothetical protein
MKNSVYRKLRRAGLEDEAIDALQNTGINTPDRLQEAHVYDLTAAVGLSHGDALAVVAAFKNGGGWPWWAHAIVATLTLFTIAFIGAAGGDPYTLDFMEWWQWVLGAMIAAIGLNVIANQPTKVLDLLRAMYRPITKTERWVTSRLVHGLHTVAVVGILYALAFLAARAAHEMGREEGQIVVDGYLLPIGDWVIQTAHSIWIAMSAIMGF